MYSRDDLKDLTLVAGCETNHGFWMRATGPGAARVADQISGHGIGRFIADRFNEEKVASFLDEYPDGKIPEYYMLVDDPEAPTISHVSLGAPKGDLWGVTKLMDLPIEGFAGGYHTKFGAPREMRSPMKILSDAEGLAFDRSFTGEKTADKWTISKETHGYEDAITLVQDERGRCLSIFDEESQILILEGHIKSFDDVESVRELLASNGKISPDAEYFEAPLHVVPSGPSQDDPDDPNPE